jgi:hypothetical protein
MDELSEKIFKAEISVINKHLKQLGKYLIIREHSHSDYHVGGAANEFSTCKNLLKDDYFVLSVLTVRHPVDSYLSLINNGWIHFSPSTFNEYCGRYLLFVEHNKDLLVCKYEDFVDDTVKELKVLCECLDLPFNEDFLDLFDLNVISGDSGRSSNIISKRKRRDYNENFYKELNKSTNYFELCEQLQYEPSITPVNIAVD